MVLKYHISPAPELMEDMVVKIYEASNSDPGAEVYTQVIAQAVGGGHPNPTTITANGLDTVVHVVRLYTALSASLLHNYNAEPMAAGGGAVVFDPIRFKIGDGNLYTPDPNTNQYTNPLLNGLGDDDYSVFRNNYGYLFPGVHYNTNPGGGSFQLIDADVFGDAEEFIIQRKSTVSSGYVVNDSVVGKWVGGFVDINGDLSYIAAHLRKLFRFQATSEYTFPALGAIPIGYGFPFQNFSTITGKIKFLNAPLLFGGATVSEITLKPFSEGCFVFDGANWNVVYLSESSSFNEVPATTPGTILAVGRFLVGNVPSAATLFAVIHNKNITGDYIVFLSVEGTQPTAAADANIVVSWRHDGGDKPNRFWLITREPNPAASNNNATICYQLVKI